MLYAVVESVRYDQDTKSMPRAVRRTPQDAFQRARVLALQKVSELELEMNIKGCSVRLDGQPGAGSRWQVVGPEGQEWEWFSVMDLADHD